MSTASPASTRPAALPVECVVHKYSEAARATDRSVSGIKFHCAQGTYSVLTFGKNKRILDGDRPFNGTEPGDHGPEQLRKAFKGRTHLAVGDIAATLQVSTRKVLRWLRSGELPGYIEKGRWTVGRWVFIEWMLDHRTPSKYETGGLA